MNKTALKKFSGPIFLFILLLTVVAIWKIFKLPPDDVLIPKAREYFEQYGLIVVFISSIIEGLCFAGWYYPGSLVIFLGVIFAGKNIPLVAITVLLVILGLYIAYIINYFIGKYGWYRFLMFIGLRQEITKMQDRLERHELRTIFFTYHDPNLASLAFTAAGISRLPFRRFAMVSFLFAVLWNSFWGILTYFFGDKILGLLGFWFVAGILFVWVLIITFSKKTIALRQ